MSNPITHGEHTLKVATSLQTETGYPPIVASRGQCG